MRLAEKLIPRSYHLLNYDWTPLSRNPCWLSSVVHQVCWHKPTCRSLPWCFRAFISATITWGQSSFRSMEMINLLYTTDSNPSIVSAESSLCVTIHWCSSCVLWFVHSMYLVRGLWNWDRWAVCVLGVLIVCWKHSRHDTPNAARGWVGPQALMHWAFLH